jgi:hypothetical protein
MCIHIRTIALAYIDTGGTDVIQNAVALPILT